MAKIQEGNIAISPENHRNYIEHDTGWILTNGDLGTSRMLSCGHDDTSQLTQTVIYSDKEMKDKLLSSLKEDNVLPTDRICLFRTLQSEIDQMHTGNIKEDHCEKIFEGTALEMADLLGDPDIFQSYHQIALLIKETEMFQKPVANPITEATIQLFGSGIHHEAELKPELPAMESYYELESDKFEERNYRDYRKETLEALLADDWMKPDAIEYVIEGIACSNDDVDMVNLIFCDKMYDILDFEKKTPAYKDLPIVFYLDAILTKVAECCKACGDQRGFERVDKLSEQLANTFKPLIEDFNPNQRNMNEWTPADGYGFMERETMRWFMGLDNAISDEEITECFIDLAKMNYVVGLKEDMSATNTPTMELFDFGKKKPTPGMRFMEYREYAYRDEAWCRKCIAILKGVIRKFPEYKKHITFYTTKPQHNRIDNSWRKIAHVDLYKTYPTITQEIDAKHLEFWNVLRDELHRKCGADIMIDGDPYNTDLDFVAEEYVTKTMEVPDNPAVTFVEVPLESTSLLEGKTARQATRKAEQGVRKATRKTGRAIGNANHGVKRVIDPIEKFITQTTDKIKAADDKERRDIVMKGGSVPKVLRWLKRSIGILAGAAVGTVVPAAAVLSAIAFIGFICTDKYLDKKTRAQVLRELEDEIQICNEKIEDSRGDDNKQKKYELIRIRNKLTRTSEKIKLGLKY